MRAANFSPNQIANGAAGHALEIARQEAERCLQCPKEYCIEGCPVAVNIPRFISYLRDGDVHAAAESLLGDNALPCVTGRVCPQETQCEQVCLRAKTGRPVAIGYLERFVADWAQAHNGELAHAIPQATQKKVAIVGAGRLHRGMEVERRQREHAQVPAPGRPRGEAFCQASFDIAFQSRVGQASCLQPRSALGRDDGPGLIVAGRRAARRQHRQQQEQWQMSGRTHRAGSVSWLTLKS